MDAIDTFNETVPVIEHYFTGKRRELFLASIEVIRESLEQGAWVKRGFQRADKGLNKGIASHKALTDRHLRYDDPRREALFRCYMAAQYGPRHLTQTELDVATDADLSEIAPKVPTEIMRAWLRLMVAVREIYADLDASRPAPVYTEIGLSRKVTATLQDAGLDLDLTTRRMCPLGWYWGTERRPDGRVYNVKIYYPKWPDDTVFETSRFRHHDCEACGKRIPSRAVVPVIVNDRTGVPNGFWFGVDCARNILGIKDVGIEKPKSEGQ